MKTASKRQPSRDKVREHRKRLRAQGLRPLQIWVPDTRSAAFKSQAHRQSLIVARSAQAQVDQDFIDAISGDWLKRGEIWTVAGGKDYAGKPRPAVIVQDDRFDATGSITICAITSDKSEAPLFRIVIQPSDQNRLTTTSRLMVDKITTIPKSKLGSRIGNLDAVDMARVNQAMLIFLGLAG
jgi:mRNA interferase MazF